MLNTSKNVALTTEVPPPSAVGCYNAPVFRSNGFFNTLFRCRAPASVQKTFREVWRMMFNFCKFLPRIVAPPPPGTNWSARMKFCTTGPYMWITGPEAMDISFPWTPTTNLGHEVGNALQASLGLGNCASPTPAGTDLDVAKIESHWLSSGTGEFSPTCCSRNRFAAAFGPASFTWLFNANCPSWIVSLDLSKAFTGARVNPAMCFAFW